MSADLVMRLKNSETMTHGLKVIYPESRSEDNPDVYYARNRFSAAGKLLWRDFVDNWTSLSSADPNYQPKFDHGRKYIAEPIKYPLLIASGIIHSIPVYLFGLAFLRYSEEENAYTFKKKPDKKRELSRLSSFLLKLA